MTDQVVNSSKLGQRTFRRDALPKVLGSALYPDDLNRPDQLALAVRFTDKPHARFTLDTNVAEKMAGVIRIFTAADVPLNLHGLIEPDQPVLADGYVRSMLDKLALVAATTREQARAAAAAIKVVYDELPVIASVEMAKTDNVPQLHSHRPGNLHQKMHIERGDIKKGFAQAAAIVESSYQTHPQEHAFLQPEAGIAYIDEIGRIVLETAGQWVQEDHRQVAEALKLPAEQVLVRYVYTGGAFGGREDISIQILLALAAWKLQKPVKLVWSRDESIRGHHKRHPAHFVTKWGATADGKICAVETQLLLDGGAYASTSEEVLKNAVRSAIGPYEVENLQLDGSVYFTNNLPNGAFRGFGALQAAFCHEMQIEKLAVALNIDPVELRIRNLYREGSIEPTGNTVPPGVGVLRTLETAAKEIGWQYMSEAGWKRPKIEQPQETTRKRGIGIVCGMKNVGYSFGFPEKSSAEVEIQGSTEIEKVIVRHSAAEVGQGIITTLSQIVAEILNVPIEKIELAAQFDNTAPMSGSASASRLAYMAGNAVKGAAERALQQWLGEKKPPVRAFFEYHAPATTSADPITGASTPNFSYGYTTQAVDLEVDTETGLLEIKRLVSVNDVGKALNPQIVEGQIEGAVAQGLGWTITEDFKQNKGLVQTRNFTEYLIPTVMDVPRTETHILEIADPNGPFGARGVGEMAMVTVAPAITIALYYATGSWINSLPLTPERVFSAITEEKLDE